MYVEKELTKEDFCSKISYLSCLEKFKSALFLPLRSLRLCGFFIGNVLVTRK
jgi:hypothetical protein